MPRLFLIRHGEPETAWGGADPDPGLSTLGHVQAEAAAAHLAGEGPLAILSSPMRRCRETAAPATAVLGITPSIEARVSEVAAPSDIADRRAWLRANFPWQDPSARRHWNDLDEGVREWRDAVIGAAQAVERDAAIFTHFIAINALVGAALGRSETIVCRPGYASITELELRDGALRLVRLGADPPQERCVDGRDHHGCSDARD